MINFESVDFSERRPEEVISFFWRSMYIVVDYYCLLFVYSTSVMYCSLALGL